MNNFQIGARYALRAGNLEVLKQSTLMLLKGEGFPDFLGEI